MHPTIQPELITARVADRTRQPRRHPGVVCMAIRREEKNLTLTSDATSPVIRAGRWLNGVGVRAPHR